MKSILKRLGLGVAAVSLAVSPVMAADDGYCPKEEMRAAWVAALGIDFPLSTRGATETAAATQTEEIIRYLDAMKEAGLNCVFIHMRPMADRLYVKNSYNGVTVNEPMSHYITGTRGEMPAYDPLEVWVEEGHKRGMEVHAWLNPYRYCNYTAASIPEEGFNPYSTEEDKALFESGMLIRNSYKSGNNYVTNFIFNPALDSSVQRICDVCTVLAGNYDLDGLLFDDYFYPDGIAEGASAPDWSNYQAYKEAGGTMSMGDWRRDNVNRMVHTVYTHCKSIKPWLRFGISPAGAAGKGLRASDELPPLSQYCAAGDWQYNGIYSDPIAWLRNKDLDWISPQIYWTTTHSTNPFGPMVNWWTLVAAKFERPIFVSTYLSNLGNNNNDAYRAELCNQVTLERKYVEQNGGQPGVVFFSAKYIDGYTNYGLEKAVKETNFSREAIMPAMTWHPASNPGLVDNIERTDNKLSWTGYEGMRYTVYAVPSSLPQENFDCDPEYLLGFTYTTEFEIPENRTSGYNYAVCVYDRFSYEYSPRFMGAATKSLEKPVLVAPENNANLETPIEFSWQPVADARSYALEIATNAEMTQLVCVTGTADTHLSTADMKPLPLDVPLYWRVRACGPNFNDGVSETRTLTVQEVRITNPVTESDNVALSPVIEWTIPERPVTLEIATDNNFDGKSLVHSADATGGTYTVPDYSLAGFTQYFLRLRYNGPDGSERCTPTTFFTTCAAEPAVPVLAVPVAGGILYSDSHIAVEPMHGPKSVRVEVSATTTFSGRSSYICSAIAPGNWADPNEGSAIKLSNKALVDGQTYYARARATFKTGLNSTEDTEYCQPMEFTYSAELSGVNKVTADGGFAIDYSNPSAPVIRADRQGRIAIYDMSGALQAEAEGSSLRATLRPGVYVATFTAGTARRTAKLVIR